MASVRENPIARRSKKSIVDAMMDLLKDKSYEKITIKEIMEKADMARRTFYGNFSSKDEIIQYYFGNLFDTLELRLKGDQKVNPKKMAQALFELVLEDKENMMVAKKRGLLNMALVEAYSGEIAKLFNRDDQVQSNQMTLKYAAGFYLGGVWKIIDQWLGEGAKVTPVKMAELFQNMISGTVFGHNNHGSKI